jgi:hypothetical protein
MSKKSSDGIFLGNSKLHEGRKGITGEFTEIDDESFYKISGYNEMDPFFMTIVSSSDHWMFISSNGALSAGRRDPDHALFPYYTVDKIQDSNEITGSKTLFLVTRNNKTSLWEPFSERYSGIYNIQRNIYKSIYGNKILFEELNHDLEMTFAYMWMNSEKFGFIRKAELFNNGNSDCSISLLDGIQNILPAGINRVLQLSYSNLVDAYKKNELLENNTTALFMLSSVIVDRAEPSEALTANMVWSDGFPDAKILLSTRQVENFRKGDPLETEMDIRASRGAYLINTEADLLPGSGKSWYIVADVDQNAGQLASLNHLILNSGNIASLLRQDVAECTDNLINIVAAADGLQLTDDKLTINRHLSNVLFNVLRGGIFDDNYIATKEDLLHFISGANRLVYARNMTLLESLEDTFTIPYLTGRVYQSGDPQLIRLCYEYLPLKLSRRHGDPSRPWNIFSIELKNEDGSKNLNFQGNWRDIFQNWEALALSYPAFVESIICKFLNASTADGYNPYRITRGGIDWESPDPHDPWAGIGYWGDHQVIYLLKFLEISVKYHPGKLAKMLSENIFSYSDVPYRIKPYNDLVANPFVTIDFDYTSEKSTLQRVEKTGSDGKLIPESNGEIKLVTFTEKILVNILTKLSNFIPEAGIWLNTQRPEWNDANNALVGNGASMVTLYYLRRLQNFCKELFGEDKDRTFEISDEVVVFFRSVNNTLQKFESSADTGFSDRERRLVANDLGMAGSSYRWTLYNRGFSGEKKMITGLELSSFFELSLKYSDQSILKNRRGDNLYHSYNLISFDDDSIKIRRLYEMLEGQVAVLSSGLLNPSEVIEVLDALKDSALFRSDQYSYLLYPDRQLPRFTKKNIIPSELVSSSKLLTALIADTDSTILYKDIDGLYHFNKSFRNSSYLKHAIDLLVRKYNISSGDKDHILEIYEKVFDHQSFTGRSGTFYGFEGLGCIYWHMVSKLLLAICENYFIAQRAQASDIQLGKIVNHFYNVRAGIGLNKDPEVFGAFPTDAYSHTPGWGGAKQPGMTGQVKEDIITRSGELGIIVDGGMIGFNPGLLRRSEFLQSPGIFRYIDIYGGKSQIKVEPGSLAFTFCQVPVIYHISVENKISITLEDGIYTIPGSVIDLMTSNEIFERSGIVHHMDVFLNPGLQ